jgi:concanavalin A-like lectin/glucanase superfamily protein/glycosyl hydrolase family 10
MKRGGIYFTIIALVLTVCLQDLCALSSVNQNSAAEITFHADFSGKNWIKHASGYPDVFVMDGKLTKGIEGNGVLISETVNASQIELENNLNKEKGAITLWYKPSFKHGKKHTYPLLWTGNSTKLGKNSMWLWLWHGVLRFDVRDPEDRYCTYPIVKWQTNEWVHIGINWNYKKGISLWINGEKVAQKKSKWQAFDTGKLLIGTNYRGSFNAGGVIDELKIFNQPLTAEEMVKEYNRESILKYAKKIKPETVVSRQRKDEKKLKILFELDFENEFNAIVSDKEVKPTNKNLPQLVEGIMGGRAAHFSDATVLRYLEKESIDKKRGALSMWVSPSAKYLSKSWIYLFREDASMNVGENSMMIWSHAERGLRCDPRDQNDSFSYIVPAAWWKPGEWHHIIYCWDHKIGTRTYIDGKLAAYNATSDAKKSFIPVTWNPKTHKAFLFGARDSAGQYGWGGAIDQIRIYNRMLSEKEVHLEYSKNSNYMVNITTIDPYLYADKKELCRVFFENFINKPISISPSYTVQNISGKIVQYGDFGNLQLGINQKVEKKLSLKLPAKGDYYLKIEYKNNDKICCQSLNIKALAQHEKQTTNQTEKLICKIDPTQQPVHTESALSQIVHSEIGNYREAGANLNDRFAYKFRVDHTNKPHLAIITYPDDKPRTMEVLLNPLETAFDYQAQTGVYTGHEYPLSNKMLKHSFIFWPRCQENVLIFTTIETGLPAAVKNIEIYELVDGIAKLTTRPFSGSVPARHIGMYHEDPVLGKCYGNFGTQNKIKNMDVFPGFEHTTSRMLDYLQSFAQDTLHYPIVWYRGALYGSDVEPAGYGGRPHPYNYPQYLMKRLHARGMKFNGWFHCHHLPSIANDAIIDEKRVIAGDETVLSMRCDNHLETMAWHGKDSVYNPISPKVQNAIKLIIAEVLERYGNEPAFTGITLNTVRHSMLAFGSIAAGYNDCNLARFSKDTGIIIPVDRKDRLRFSKSYKWLMKNAKKQWIDWRCKMIHSYYQELAAMLQKKRNDLKLRIVLFAREQDAEYLNPNKNAIQKYKEQGIDPDLFQNDKNIILVHSIDASLYRFKRRNMSKTPFSIEDCRTASFAPEILPNLRKLPTSSLNMHDKYFENPVGRHAPLKFFSSKAKECGWRVSALNPNSFYCLETYANGMDRLDPLTITKGGFLVGFFGMEPYLAKFSQAFRTLPAIKFDDVKKIEDPIRCRQKKIDGATYFYLLNKLPINVKMDLTINHCEDVIDLQKGSTSENFNNGVLGLTLAPYELCTFKINNQQAEIVSGKSSFADDFKQKLQQKLISAKKMISSYQGAGMDVSNIKPYYEYARQCFQQKKYARLYFLFQESWFENMLRIKNNKHISSFFSGNKNYIKQVQAVKQLKATKMDKEINIDGVLDEPEWGNAKEYDQMSDFLVYLGNMIARPAKEKISVRFLYDDKCIYIGVYCRESDMNKMVVKKGLHDSFVWAGDDAIEIFLRSPEMGKSGHAHFGVNAGGSKTDLLTGNIRWNPEWKAATKIVKDGWIAEVAIPYDILVKKGSPASKWTFNISRTRRTLPKSALTANNEKEWKCEALFAELSFE